MLRRALWHLRLPRIHRFTFQKLIHLQFYQDKTVEGTKCNINCLLFSIQWLWRENKYFIFTHETEGRLGEKTRRKEGKARENGNMAENFVMRVALRNKEKLSSMNPRKKEDQEMKAIYFKLSLRLFLITLREFEFEKLSGKTLKKIQFPLRPE